MEPVQSFGSRLDRGPKSDAKIRSFNVVVYGFGNGDYGKTFGKLLTNAQCPVSPYGDKSVKLELLEIAFNLGNAVFKLQRIYLARTEYGPSFV
jgi:hypothetical protein